MTQRGKKVFARLKSATERNTHRVEQNLSKAGRPANAAVVASAAKYYDALKKLAPK